MADIKAQPTVAIQIGAISFVDEGTEKVLDTLQSLGGVNALFIATPTWTRGTGGRQIPGHPLPDHGVQEYDHGWKGGNYATVHEEFYKATALGAAGRAREHPHLDIFAEIIPAAKKRGIKNYAWMEESSYTHVRVMPNFIKVSEIDALGRRTGTSCMNHPDYRMWWISILEDYCRSYELDGLAFCSERNGPLHHALSGSAWPIISACFCQHCRNLAKEKGVDIENARSGFQKLTALSERAKNSRSAVSADKRDRPSDGWFINFWRVLLEHPHVLAWENFWAESQRSLYRELYGTVKSISSNKLMGWHIHHVNSFSPFYRATQNYADLANYSDFIKVVMYHNCAGPRFRGHVNNVSRAVFADHTPEQNYAWLCRVLGYDETQPPFEDIYKTGFNAEYVRRETERALAGVAGRCQIWPGIDIDIPTGSDQAQSSPEGVKAAVLAAFKAGAQGVVLSRKYSEMKLTNLKGAGEALKELGN